MVERDTVNILINVRFILEAYIYTNTEGFNYLSLTNVHCIIKHHFSYDFF